MKALAGLRMGTALGGPLLAILGASLVTAMATTVITPALPGIAASLAEDSNAVFLAKLSLTLPALVIVLTAGLAGALIDRVGPKPVLVGSLLLYALAGASGALASSLSELLVGRAFLGLAVAGISTAALTSIGMLYRGEAQQRVVGYHGAATSFGGMAFLVVGAFLATMGWRWVFVGHLGVLLLVPVVMMCLPSLTAAVRERSEPSASGRIDRPRLLGAYALVFLATALFYVIPVQLPFEFAARGLAPQVTGFALATCTCAAGTAGLLQHRLTRDFGAAGVAALALLLIGLGQLSASMPGPATAFVGMGLAGAGIGLLLPTVNAIVLSASPPALRGRLAGGALTCLFLAQFLAPFLSEAILRQGAMVFVTTGIAAIFTSLVVLASALTKVGKARQ